MCCTGEYKGLPAPGHISHRNAHGWSWRKSTSCKCGLAAIADHALGCALHDPTRALPVKLQQLWWVLKRCVALPGVPLLLGYSALPRKLLTPVLPISEALGPLLYTQVLAKSSSSPCRHLTSHCGVSFGLLVSLCAALRLSCFRKPSHALCWSTCVWFVLPPELLHSAMLASVPRSRAGAILLFFCNTPPCTKWCLSSAYSPFFLHAFLLEV